MTLEDFLLNHPKKHLIFDLDGTLARLEIDWTNIHRLLFDEIKSIDQNPTLKISTNAREFYTLINQTVSKCGVTAKKRTVKFMSLFEKSNYSGFTMNNELMNFVRSHNNEYVYSIWTSNTRSTIQDFVKKENITALFQNIITLNDVKFSKPQPDGFYKIFDITQDKKWYLMIGDSPNDEEAAKNAGIDFYQIDFFKR